MKKLDIKKIIFLIFLTNLFSFQTSLAEDIKKVGTSAATFLRIPIGARAAGMGSSFVSMINDPSALYWNPAAMSTIKSNSLVVDHSIWLPGINFDFAGLTIPIENLGIFGLGVTIMHTDEMEVTTVEEPMGTGETFTASSFAIGVSYSRFLTDKFSIGGTFKYIQETIFNSSAAGIAFDVGTLYELPFAGLRLGASISNFGTKMNISGEDLNIRVDVAPNQQGDNQSIVGKLNTDEFDLPLIMRIGISGEVVNTKDYRFTISLDGVDPNDNSQSVNLGGEIGLFNEKIRLRAGYKDLFLENSEQNFAFGLSLNEINVITDVLISIEYAYQNFVHLGNSNRFTLNVRF
ncbi:MAG: PorV/PorQ family protein [Ignavibacteriaceae bacterium]|nr:PorV/PorQ family protein [Ignavibacteriaceae bacterium]